MILCQCLTFLDLVRLMRKMLRLSRFHALMLFYSTRRFGWIDKEAHEKDAIKCQRRRASATARR